MDGTVTLLREEFYSDSLGNQLSREICREVFSREGEITRQEFFSAAQAGLRPSVRLTVCRWDYQGEETAVYQGERHRVYRVYAPADSDEMELYLTKEMGG